MTHVGSLRRLDTGLKLLPLRLRAARIRRAHEKCGAYALEGPLHLQRIGHVAHHYPRAVGNQRFGTGKVTRERPYRLALSQ